MKTQLNRQQINDLQAYNEQGKSAEEIGVILQVSTEVAEHYIKNFCKGARNAKARKNEDKEVSEDESPPRKKAGKKGSKKK